MIDWIVAWFSSNGLIGSGAIVVAACLVAYGLIRFLINLFKPNPLPPIKYPRPPEEPPKTPVPPKPEEPHL